MISSSLHVCFADTSTHYYVMLLRSGVNIVASRCVSTQDSMVLGCLELPGQIVMNCVPCDFTAYLDVYSMVCGVQVLLCLERACACASIVLIWLLLGTGVIFTMWS